MTDMKRIALATLVTVEGSITGLNTADLDLGPVWLTSAGTLTTVEPDEWREPFGTLVVKRK